MEKRGNRFFISPLFILFIVFFSVFAYPVEAANEENFLKHTSSGNAFGGGDNVRIDQDIEGDLVLAGSLLEINGKVADDFIGAGGELIVNGDVSGNIIAAGGSIKVNGDVGGDVAALGGHIFLSKDSVVEGDVLLGGGEVTLNGVVNGNGDISASTFRTGNNFNLKGNLALQAENYPSNLDDKVEGNVSITRETRAENQYESTAGGFWLFSLILELLSALIIGLILIYLFPDFIRTLTEIVSDSTLKAGGIGFLMLVFLPILSIILLFTIIGWSLSFAIMLLLFLAILIATVPIKLLTGKVVYNRVFNKNSGKMTYYLIGAVIFTIAYAIPLIGGIIRIIILFIGVGAIGIWLGGHIKSRA